MKFWRVIFAVWCLVGNTFADTLDAALTLAQRTLAYVEKSERRPAMAAELNELAQQVSQVKDSTARQALEEKIRLLRRRILFSHPDLSFERLLACQRHLPYSHATHMVDQYLGRYSRPGGAGLIVIDDWKTTPKKREILKGKLPLGTTLNPDLHWNGDRVLFAFCDHTDHRTPLQKLIPVPSGTLGRKISRTNSSTGRSVDRVDPTNPIFDDEPFNHPATALRYFVYEAALDGSWVRQLTGTENDPMKTWEDRQTVLIEDVDPCYLPDGGFVFTSTRCQGYGRCHDARYAPSFMIYRADKDGSNIRQLSFGEANEWEPSVLNDGRIAYTRWDYIDRNAVPWQSLWSMNPDGTGTAHFFGNYTPVPKVMSEIKSIPDTQIVVATGGAHHFFTAGCPILIDPRKGEDGSQAITKIAPEITFPGSPWKDTGYFANPFPVNETLCFASFSPMGFHKNDSNYCSYGWSSAWPATNSFKVYLIDTLGGRELIFEDAEINTFSPIPICKRKRPPEMASNLPPSDKAPDTGICSVENVYNCRMPIKTGCVKALRLNRVLAKWTAAHPERNQLGGYPLYKTPIGTVPVNPDGSVAFRMPAGVPVQLQALDENGMAVMTMRSFIYVQKGEQLRCVGCHENRIQAPQRSSRKDMPVSDPVPVPNTENGVGYDRQARPVFDRHCIGCHGLNADGKPAGGLSLIGYKGWDRLTRVEGQKRQPESLVARAHPYTETGYSQTNDYFAAPSPLTKKLQAGHKGIKLTQSEWSDLIIWMDLNAQELPSSSWNLPEFATQIPAGVQGLRDYIQSLFGDELSRQPYDALVNTTLPEKSRILLAPLPVEKGGWGQISGEKGYTGKDDPRYIKMEALIRASFKAPPYEDAHGTCNRRKACSCLDCWVWMGRYNEPPGTHGLVTLPVVGRLTNDVPVLLDDSVDGTLELQGPGMVTLGRHMQTIGTLELDHGATASIGSDCIRVGKLTLASGATLVAASDGETDVKTVVLDGDETSFLFGTLKDGPHSRLAIQKAGNGVLYVSEKLAISGGLTVDNGTVFIVNQPEGAPQYGGIWDAEKADCGTDYGIRCVDGNIWAGGTNLPYNTFNSYRIDGAEDTLFTPGQPYILCARRDRADQLKIPIAWGSYFWPMGRSYKGKIGEVLANNRLLTETELQEVENYLSKKWLGRLVHAHGEEKSGTDAHLVSLVNVTVGKQGTLDLNGRDLTVLSLSGSGRIINSSLTPETMTVKDAFTFIKSGKLSIGAAGTFGQGDITNNSDARVTLRVTGDCSFRGVIAGNIKLVKSGSSYDRAVSTVCDDQRHRAGRRDGEPFSLPR